MIESRKVDMTRKSVIQTGCSEVDLSGAVFMTERRSNENETRKESAQHEDARRRNG